MIWFLRCHDCRRGYLVHARPGCRAAFNWPRQPSLRRTRPLLAAQNLGATTTTSMLGTEPPAAGKSTAAPFARRRRVPSILDPRYHFAAPSRVEPKDPDSGRTSAATRLRSPSRTQCNPSAQTPSAGNPAPPRHGEPTLRCTISPTAHILGRVASCACALTLLHRRPALTRPERIAPANAAVQARPPSPRTSLRPSPTRARGPSGLQVSRLFFSTRPQL